MAVRGSAPRDPRLSFPASAQVAIPLALTFPDHGSLLFEVPDSGHPQVSGTIRAEPTPATFTLVQFDSQDPYEVVQPVGPLAAAQPLTLETYVPRASTPLYDELLSLVKAGLRSS